MKLSGPTEDGWKRTTMSYVAHRWEGGATLCGVVWAGRDWYMLENTTNFRACPKCVRESQELPRALRRARKALAGAVAGDARS